MHVMINPETYSSIDTDKTQVSSNAYPKLSGHIKHLKDSACGVARGTGGAYAPP